MSTDEHDRLRRRARVWTAVLAAPLVFLVAQLVYSGMHHEASGAFVFLITGMYAIPVWFVVGHLWRRARRARPDEHAPVARAGLPGLPDPRPEDREHLALGGTLAPPTRW